MGYVRISICVEMSLDDPSMDEGKMQDILKSISAIKSIRPVSVQIETVLSPPPEELEYAKRYLPPKVDKQNG